MATDPFDDSNVRSITEIAKDALTILVEDGPTIIDALEKRAQRYEEIAEASKDPDFQELLRKWADGPLSVAEKINKVRWDEFRAEVAALRAAEDKTPQGPTCPECGCLVTDHTTRVGEDRDVCCRHDCYELCNGRAIEAIVKWNN